MGGGGGGGGGGEREGVKNLSGFVFSMHSHIKSQSINPYTIFLIQGIEYPMLLPPICKKNNMKQVLYYLLKIF